MKKKFGIHALAHVSVLLVVVSFAWADAPGGTQMTCHENCNGNFVNCSSNMQPCCTGGKVGGPYGYCRCTLASKCEGPNDEFGDKTNN
jgi:hypothetical protein